MSATRYGTRQEYRVREVGRGRYAVVDQAGVRVGGIFADRDKAEDSRDAHQRRLDRARNANERPCLCCGQTFRSEGIHNRMCTPCRAGASDLPPQFTAAAAVSRPRQSR